MSKLMRQIALVSQTSQVSPSEIARAGAAMQKQIARDFGPIWEIQASVDVFPALEDVPVGYWPVTIVDYLKSSNAAGFHLDRNGQPYALVQYDDLWTLSLSHEILEMLADPFGNRLQAGNSIEKSQGRVEYLVEVCDPCEDVSHAYRVNGVLVSDFYTPNYFDPVQAPGVRYSFTGSISKPCQVLENGYLSWFCPIDGYWYQSRWIGTPRPVLRNLGILSHQRCLRNAIDSVGSYQDMFRNVSNRNKQIAESKRIQAFNDDASSESARALREDIANAISFAEGGRSYWREP